VEARRTPLGSLILDGLEKLRRRRNSTLEGSGVTFFPKKPSNEEEKGVETSPNILRKKLTNSKPPVKNRFLLHPDDGLQPDKRKHMETNLLTVRTA
jgi:hypothetical protein